MPSIVRLRGIDGRTWRTATWLAPFVAPVLLGTMLIVMWLVGKLPVFAVHERAWFVTGAVVTGVVSMAISGFLYLLRSLQLRGLALSIAGSTVIVLVGGFSYSFLALR